MCQVTNSPVHVTDLGIVMLAKDLQCAKTPDNLQVCDELSARHRLGDSHARQRLAMCQVTNSPVHVTDLGIVMLAKDLQCAKTPDNLQVCDELSARHRLGDSHARQRLAMCQVTNSPVHVTDLGIVMLAKDLQCAKAPDNPRVGDELSRARHRLRDSYARQRFAMCKDN